MYIEQEMVNGMGVITVRDDGKMDWIEEIHSKLGASGARGFSSYSGTPS